MMAFPEIRHYSAKPPVKRLSYICNRFTPKTPKILPDMRLLYPTLLVFFFACRSSKPTSLPIVSAVGNGQITLADGSKRPIPHAGDPAYTTFYIVRDCENTQAGPDPELSTAGKARAERLGKVMDNARIDRVCTTNTKRAVATGAAVQYWAGGPPTETFPAEAQTDWLEETLSNSTGKNLFYVGQFNTVSLLLNQLTGNLDYPDLPAQEFGRFYIAVTKGRGQTEVLEFQY